MVRSDAAGLAIRQHCRVEALPQRPQARFADLLKDLRAHHANVAVTRAAAEGEGDHMRCRGSYAQRTSSWVEPVPKTLSKPNFVASAPDTSARAQQWHAWGAEFWVLLWVGTFLLEILQRGVGDGEELRRSGVLANVGLHTSIDTRPRGLHSRSGLSRRHGSAWGAAARFAHAAETTSGCGLFHWVLAADVAICAFFSGSPRYFRVFFFESPLLHPFRRLGANGALRAAVGPHPSPRTNLCGVWCRRRIRPARCRLRPARSRRWMTLLRRRPRRT